MSTRLSSRRHSAAESAPVAAPRRRTFARVAAGATLTVLALVLALPFA